MKLPENKQKLAEADASYYLRVVSTDALAETLELELDIDPFAAPGMRQILLRTKAGISIPKNFVVSNLPEYAKPSLRETSIARAKSPLYKNGATAMGNKKFAFPEPDPALVELPVVVNGQIAEGRVDKYKFALKKGEKVWASAAARALIPYISDAVPGWFQIVLRVLGPDGKEAAYNDDSYHMPDSHLCFSAPSDGEYTLEIRDAVCRGREDFVYRVELSKTPLIPPAEKFSPPPVPPKNIVFEGGAIDAKGGVHRHFLEMKKGEKVVAEVFARRGNSPLDSLLWVSSPEGKVLALSDDFTDETFGLVTHHADSKLAFSAPADGRYAFSVIDAAGGFSKHHKFALSLSRPCDGFKIVSFNSSAGARKNSVAAFRLKIFREGGRKYPITLSANLPEGWRLLNPKIPAGASEHELLVGTRGDFGIYKLDISASAQAGGKTLSARVMPADYLMQAFYYRHFVPADSFYCAVVETSIARLAGVECCAENLSKGVSVPLGGRAIVRYARAKRRDCANILVPSLSCDILKITKHYFDKGFLHVVVEPTDKAKAGMSARAHISLSAKVGRKVYAFDKTEPINFNILPPKKDAPKTAKGNIKAGGKKGANSAPAPAAKERAKAKISVSPAPAQKASQ